jgi:hypothetical protein
MIDINERIRHNKLKSEFNKKIDEAFIKGNIEGIGMLTGMLMHTLDNKQDKGLDEVINRKDLEDLIEISKEFIKNQLNKQPNEKTNKKIIKPV